MTPAQQAELTSEIQGLRHDVKGLTEQVARQNGRIGKLEEKDVARAVAEARREGREEAKEQVVVSKQSLAKLGTLFALLSALVNVVLKFI